MKFQQILEKLQRVKKSPIYHDETVFLDSLEEDQFGSLAKPIFISVYFTVLIKESKLNLAFFFLLHASQKFAPHPIPSSHSRSSKSALFETISGFFCPCKRDYKCKNSKFSFENKYQI